MGGRGDDGGDSAGGVAEGEEVLNRWRGGSGRVGGCFLGGAFAEGLGEGATGMGVIGRGDNGDEMVEQIAGEFGEGTGNHDLLLLCNPHALRRLGVPR